MVRLLVPRRIAAKCPGKGKSWPLGMGRVFLTLSVLTLSVVSQSSAWGHEWFGYRLLNEHYGYTPKYYGHEPTGYVWPIHGARYAYAAPYYLNLPAMPLAYPAQAPPRDYNPHFGGADCECDGPFAPRPPTGLPDRASQPRHAAPVHLPTITDLP